MEGPRFSFNSSAITGVFNPSPVSLDQGHYIEGSIESLIDQVADPTYIETNLSLVLEICDRINQKGKSMPRTAAFHILKHVNRSNQQSALHALTLLDYCVKNCGYPFQLIISTKEFLNELVKRFPETPSHLTASQHRVLELIQQWHATLCQNSRYKHDFKHVGDMYRLLAYKGYRFPELAPESVVALMPQQTLKTAEEQEAEDMYAYGVKLEELLRIGTPAALAQANDLMKVMSGYEKRVDYKKEFDEELDRLTQKATILNDMLNHQSPISKRGSSADGTLSELVTGLKSAQKKIQTLISEEGENEKIDRLLAMNDTINSVIKKYEEFEKGNTVPKSLIDTQREETPPKQASVESPNKVGPINLIDLDDLPPAVTGVGVAKEKALLDLDSVDFAAADLSKSVPIAMMNPLEDLVSLSSPSKSTDPPIVPYNISGLSGLASVTGLTAASPETTATKKEQKQSPVVSNLLDDLDLLSLGTSKPAPASAEIRHEDVLLFDKNGLQIKLEIQKRPSKVEAKATFMNVTPVVLKDVSFQVSIPKSMTLKMGAISGNVLPAYNQDQLTQTMTVDIPTQEPFKFRYKISYNMNGAIVNEMGEYPSS